MTSDIFKALSDPTRRQILEILAREGDLSAGEIASHFEMSAPSISHHLSILKTADLLLDTRHHQHIIYHLNGEALSQALQWLQATLRAASERKSRPDMRGANKTRPKAK